MSDRVSLGSDCEASSELTALPFPLPLSEGGTLTVEVASLGACGVDSADVDDAAEALYTLTRSRTSLSVNVGPVLCEPFFFRRLRRFWNYTFRRVRVSNALSTTTQ